MKRIIFALLAAAIVLSLAACSQPEAMPGETPGAPQPQPESVEVPEQEEPESDVQPLKGVYAAQENGLYIAAADFAEELGEVNEGHALYNPDDNTIRVTVTKSTGTHTEAIEGPIIIFTADLTNGTIIYRELIPEPDNAGFQRSREDDGSLETVSDERLVEIARILREQIGVAPYGGYK